MNATDIVAWIHDGAVYCSGCAPGAGLPESEELQELEEWNPVFASEEWDSQPVCESCGGLID